MSIKQNGGVFGRNPTFNDVTVESITGGDGTFDDINTDGLAVNRVSGDGVISEYKNAGLTVGSINTHNNRLAIGSDDTFIMFDSSGTPAFWPSDGSAGLDNIIDIGDSGRRFKDIYATNGTIQTSDAREKTSVSPMSTAELNVAKKLAKDIGFFQWLKSIDKKGEGARRHCGQTVQNIIATFDSEGLDAFDYAMICYNSWKAEDGSPAGDRYALRVDQLNSFIAAGFNARLTVLEG